MSVLIMLRLVPIVIIASIACAFGVYSIATGDVERGLQSLGGAAFLYLLGAAYYFVTKARAKQINDRLNRRRAAKAAQQQQHHQQYYPQHQPHQHPQQWPGQAHGHHQQQQWHGQPQHNGWHGAPQGYPQQPQQPYHPPYPPQH